MNYSFIVSSAHVGEQFLGFLIHRGDHVGRGDLRAERGGQPQEQADEEDRDGGGKGESCKGFHAVILPQGGTGCNACDRSCFASANVIGFDSFSAPVAQLDRAAVS